MDLQLDGRIVLVTGSSAGIGQGIAEAFLKEGATVILTGRNRAILQATQDSFQRIYGSGHVWAFPGDLQQIATITKLHEFLDKEFGSLDHLVCNIGTGRSVPPLQEDEVEWQRMLEINLLSATACVRSLLPLLNRSADQVDKATSIIFIASICGVEVLGCPVAYAVAKNALITYAQNISRPLGKIGIRVNVVSPGNVIFPGSTWGDKLSRDRAAVEDMLKREVPLQRLGTVPEIADVVVFLASRRAAFVSGVNWVVDGGQTRSI